MENSIFIYYLESKKDGERYYSAVAAIELRSCPSARLFYDRFNKGGRTDVYDRFSAFITCLYRVDINVSYTIRMIMNPVEDCYSSGKIKCYLLLKTGSDKKDVLEKQIKDLQSQIFVLLGGYFIDYDWQPIKDRSDFMYVWEPTVWEEADITEIMRYQQWIALDRTKQTQPIGFLHDHERETEIPYDDQIYYLSPFLQTDINFEEMIQTLLLQSNQTILNITITPTKLTTAEMDEMQKVIACCEVPGYEEAQDSVHERIYQNRAHILLGALMNQYERLSVDPLDVRILVVSPKPLQPMILNTIGSYISSFAEGQKISLSEGALALQEGGFSLHHLSQGHEKTQAVHHLANCPDDLWIDERAPLGLRRIRWLFCAREAACAFRFPIATDQNLPGMNVHDYRIQAPPPEIADLVNANHISRCKVGYNDYLGQQLPIYLTDSDRNRHLYIVGQTGTGKTTLLKNMILSDMRAGKGLAVLDPHGDLFEDLLHFIPHERLQDVILIDPQDIDFPVGINLLECAENSQRYFVVREMRSIMEKYFIDKYKHHSIDYAGPVFYRHMQMNMLLAMSDPDRSGTLLEFYEIFNQKDYWKRWLPLKINDPQLDNWVKSVLEKMDYLARPRPQDASWGDYIGSKFEDFIFDPRLRLMFGQHHSTVDFGEVIAQQKILLVNLAKGTLGESNSSFLGMILLAKIQSEIMKQGNVAPDKRKPFYLYVDEFQTMASRNFASLLSEGRKFGLSMTLANQYLTQLDDQTIVNAIFGNVGTMITFRLGRDDAQKVESLFLPEIGRDDLCDLPNWTSAVRASCNGATVAPFLMRNIYDDNKGDDTTASFVRSSSRRRHGVAREEVEKEISDSLDGRSNAEKLADALKDP